MRFFQKTLAMIRPGAEGVVAGRLHALVRQRLFGLKSERTADVLRLQPNPLVDEVCVEVMAECDADNRSARLGTHRMTWALKDLEKERHVGCMK